MNSTGEDELSNLYRRISPWSYSVFTALIAAGVIVLSILMCDRSVRRYSSMVYLMVMAVCDTFFAIGWFSPSILLNSMVELEFNDLTCKVLQGVSFFGRAGSSTFIVVLAIERNAALRFPKRWPGLHMPSAAMVASAIVLVLLAPVSVYVSLDKVWDDRHRNCVFTVGQTGRISTQIRVIVTVVAATLVLQLIFNLTLLISLIRKRKNRVVDPIHSTISAARQNNKQLNKINFISLIMCLNCLLLNITVFVVSAISNRNHTDITRLRKSRLVVELLFLAIIAAKVPTLVLISNRLRLTVISALTCGSASRNQRGLRPLSKLKKRSQFAKSTGMQPWIFLANTAARAVADTTAALTTETVAEGASGPANDTATDTVDEDTAAADAAPDSGTICDMVDNETYPATYTVAKDAADVWVHTSADNGIGDRMDYVADSVTGNAAETAADHTAETAADHTVEIAADDAAETAADDAANGVASAATDDAADDAANGVASAATDAAADNAVFDGSDDLADCAADRVAENAADTAADNVSHYTS